MPEQYDDTNRGALFINDKGENPNRPDFKGRVNAAGTDYWVAGWKKVSKGGVQFISLSVEPQEKQEQEEPPVAAPTEAFDW